MSFKLSDLCETVSLCNYDTLQIGIQTGLKNTETGDIFYDKRSYTCSKPIIVKDIGIAIDKAYIDTGKAYNQAIIHRIER